MSLSYKYFRGILSYDICQLIDANLLILYKEPIFKNKEQILKNDSFKKFRDYIIIINIPLNPWWNPWWFNGCYAIPSVALQPYYEYYEYYEYIQNDLQNLHDNPGN